MGTIKVELQRLWAVATDQRNSLPAIAGDLTEAAEHVRRSGGSGSVAFEGELYAGLGAQWESLCGELEGILGGSATTLHAGASALKLTVARYAETDEVAAQLSDHVLRGINDFQRGFQGAAGESHAGEVSGGDTRD